MEEKTVSQVWIHLRTCKNIHSLIMQGKWNSLDLLNQYNEPRGIERYKSHALVAMDTPEDAWKRQRLSIKKPLVLLSTRQLP